MTKRMIDLAFSLVLMLIALPVLVVLMAAVALESRGPAIYAQDRVGKHGRIFKLIKLRSMVQDADQQGGYSTPRNDPRITKIGRIIIKGEMSLVGPRPDVPAQQSLYTPTQWKKRHLTRPGITGLSQAKLRSVATPRQRLAHDLYYVKHQNLCLDFKIIAMTARLVLSKLAY